MQRQLRIFFTALMFYTRIPCPSWVDHSEEYLNKSTIYFPLIGWIVGLVAATVYGLAFWLLKSEMVAILLSMVGTVLVTGAFHEDGFADVCDGFGGGWTKVKILEIMKDSRVGAYGVIGLLLLMGLKCQLLVALFDKITMTNQSINWWQSLVNLFSTTPTPSNSWQLLIVETLVLVATHSLSRFMALTLIYTHLYVRENEDAKAKPVAKKMSLFELGIAFVFGILPFVGLVIWQQQIALLIVFLPLLLCRWYLISYFVKWIGGYTGDCLGAVQQVEEVVMLLTLLALW